jgi:hypothetical protein
MIIQDIPGGAGRSVQVRVRDQAAPAGEVSRAAKVDQPGEEVPDRVESARVLSEPGEHRLRSLVEISPQ